MLFRHSSHLTKTALPTFFDQSHLCVGVPRHRFTREDPKRSCYFILGAIHPLPNSHGMVEEEGASCRMQLMGKPFAPNDPRPMGGSRDKVEVCMRCQPEILGKFAEVDVGWYISRPAAFMTTNQTQLIDTDNVDDASQQLLAFMTWTGASRYGNIREKETTGRSGRVTHGMICNAVLALHGSSVTSHLTCVQYQRYWSIPNHSTRWRLSIGMRC